MESIIRNSSLGFSYKTELVRSENQLQLSILLDDSCASNGLPQSLPLAASSLRCRDAVAIFRHRDFVSSGRQLRPPPTRRPDRRSPLGNTSPPRLRARRAPGIRDKRPPPSTTRTHDVRRIARSAIRVHRACGLLVRRKAGGIK